MYLGTEHLTCRGGAMGVFFVQKLFFRTTRELECFFCRAERKFFFQNLTLGYRILRIFKNYMTKTLNQIFFFLHQNQNILLEKKP